MSKDYRSEDAKRIEEALERKTGKASGDTEKSAERKFEEMGEFDRIREQAKRKKDS